MAGDWIKMRGNLWDDPRVARLCDLTDCGEAQIIGGLYWLWATADQHTEDGVMPGLSARQIERKTGVPGLGQALIDIGWIADHPEGIRIVNFEEHNGQSAKRRATDAQRKANVRKVSASNADNSRTEAGACVELEKEKNKEEVIPPNPPVGGGEPGKPSAAKPKRERKARVALKTFLENCRASGEKAISDYRPLLEYVEGTGLPMEFVQLAWDVFKREFLPGGPNAARLQADWRRHFLNYVTKGYYRLWYVKASATDGTNVYELSTQGLQAKAFHREAA